MSVAVPPRARAVPGLEGRHGYVVGTHLDGLKVAGSEETEVAVRV